MQVPLEVRREHYIIGAEFTGSCESLDVGTSSQILVTTEPSLPASLF